MAEITILVDGKPLDLAACRVKNTYGGLQPKNGYGDVDVEIDGKTYTLRVGEKEWWKAEQQFGVKGIDRTMVEKIDESRETLVQFYKIALSRQHPDLTVEDIADLMDWRPAPDAPKPLYDALQRALNFSQPAEFPDEDLDPKVLRALVLKTIVMRSLQESKTD